jgi:GNAT superfamily N-acetyltransferase
LITTDVCLLDPYDNRLRDILRKYNFSWHSHFTWFGIEQEEKLCGVGGVDIAGPRARLYCGVVEAEYRRRGYHNLILNARVDYAREQGCREILVGVYGWNDACKGSLIKCGFSPCHFTDPIISFLPGIATWRKELTP